MKENFKTEREFKQMYTAEWEKAGFDVIWIESPETAAGCPDVMLSKGLWYILYEFKLSDKYGYVKFKSSQPLFYKKHPNMNIQIIAYNTAAGEVVFAYAKKALEYMSGHNTLRVPLNKISKDKISKEVV